MDILDITRSRIYCPGRIISINSSSYTIHYRGWGPEHNETLTDFSLLSPVGTYVFKRKAWVKLSERLGWWPGIAYLRSAYTDDPKDMSGVENLRQTNLLFVEPICPENKITFKYYRDGYWALTSKVSPISRLENARRSAGLHNKAVSEDFMHCLKILDNDYAHISSEPFVLEGSLLVPPLNDLTSECSSVSGFKSASYDQDSIFSSPTAAMNGKNISGAAFASQGLIDAIKLGYQDIRQRCSSNRVTGIRNSDQKARWTVQKYFDEVIRSDANNSTFWDQLHFGII